VAPSTRYQELTRSLEEARKLYSDYRSDAVFFAATFARGLTDYLAGPRDLVGFEPRPGAGEGGAEEAVERAIHLDEDTYWHLGLKLRLASDKASDAIRIEVRFKKVEARYLVNLFGHEDFELTEPTPTALEPVYAELFVSMKRHYEDGLRLFLDQRGQNLHLPFSARRQLEIVGEG
jgi:hypothetical protein